MRRKETPKAWTIGYGPYKTKASAPAQVGVDYGSGDQEEKEPGVLETLVGLAGQAQKAGLKIGGGKTDKPIPTESKTWRVDSKANANLQKQFKQQQESSLMPEAPKKTGFLGMEWNPRNQLKIASMLNKGKIALGGADAHSAMNELAIGFAKLTKGIETDEEKRTSYG